MTRPRTCFLIMPIGDQRYADISVSAADLKARYDDLIKEALLIADPDLEITRADDVAIPGTITSDILTRIMHSDIVVADVTYPNPNVFYELGLRHACRTGTVIIREKTDRHLPFDIAHLRTIEYHNTPSGLKSLGEQLKRTLDHFSRHPGVPDCQFQELAKLTHYNFPDYVDHSKDVKPETNAVLAIMQSPEILDLLMRAQAGESIDKMEMFKLMASNPEIMKSFAEGMVKSGKISFDTPSAAQPENRASRRKNKRK